MAASAIFFVCRQVCRYDHWSRDGVVELKSHPFCVLTCVPAAGECASINCVVHFLKQAMYVDAGMVLA